MTTTQSWKLMHDTAISNEQKQVLCNFIMSNDKFSQGQKVKDFEKMWSDWMGCKYSVFVNSGSSANFVAHHAATNLFSPSRKSVWVTQASTWSTTVSPIVMAGNHALLCDVDLRNMSPDLNQLESLFKKHNPDFMFLAHLLGFPAVSDDLFALCEKYGVRLLEDCCESHGASHGEKKVGNFGLASTFSFYFGHHMTTIEGGMVCTNNEEMYHQSLLLRSHGLLRELPQEAQTKYQKVHENFTFIVPGYNVRNTELNAVLGMEQMRDLNTNIDIRNINFNHYVDRLDGTKYFNGFVRRGVSSFCFPIFSKTVPVSKIRAALTAAGIENRPVIGGNLYRHPFVRGEARDHLTPNADFIHDCGLYVGNNQTVTTDMVDEMVSILNGLEP